MNSKTSLFSKAIIKSDIKRFWWIAALQLVMLVMTIVPNLLNKDTIVNGVFSPITDEGVYTFIFAFALGGLLFSYLNKSNSASAMASLPLTRTSLFLSHIASAIILLAIPVAIMGAILATNNINFAIKYIYTAIIYGGCGFTLTAFTAMLSGNTLAVYIFAIGFGILPYYLIDMTNYILDCNLYGYVNMDIDKILKYFYIFGMEDICSKRSIIYIVGIIVFCILALLLYKRRNMESYGEIVVFKPLKTIFMYTVAICFAMFGYTMLWSVLRNGVNMFIGLLPLGMVALIAAFMLNNKSFSLKGIGKHIAIFVVGIGLVSAFVSLDATGYENKIPKLDEIESITAFDDLATNLDYSYGEYTDNAIYESIKYKGVITDKKDIEAIVNLHSYLIENKDNKVDENSYFDQLKITYRLKNGKKINRYYREIPQEKMLPIYQLTEYKKCAYPIINDNEKIITNVQIENSTSTTKEQYVNLDYSKLYSAINDDIMSMTGEQLTANTEMRDTNTDLKISYDETIEKDGKTYRFRCLQYLPLDESTPKTTALIKDAGYGDYIK